MAKFKYVLLGNSAAAISCVEAIRLKDKQGSIAIVSAEDSLPYSPALTTYYISGTITKEKIYYRSSDFYKKLKIKTFLGQPAIAIDRKNKKVKLASGKTLEYEKLLISIGGNPVRPDIKGINLEGVFTLRTLEDAEKIKKKASGSKNAVILGGGLVGLRGAYALHQLGMRVAVVVGSKNILSQNLDPQAAKIIENWLREKHFEIITEEGVEAIEGKNKVTKVKLRSGKTLPADIIIVGKGVRPNASIAESAGIKVDRGIVVDDFMKTSDSNIYAAGDVAQALDKLLNKKVVNAIWPVAVKQGEVAGLNMAGENKKYGGSMAKNSIDFYGLSALSIGINKVKNEGDYEIIVSEDSAKHNYRKFVIKKDIIVGATLIGDIDRAGIITGLISEGVNISNFKEALKKNRFGFMILPKVLRDKKIKVGS